MSFGRIRARYDGAPGLPGYNIWAFLDPSLSADPLRAFYAAISDCLPTGISVQVENEGDVLEESSGSLISGWTDPTPPVVVNGSGAAVHAAGVGACITWFTGGVVRGRRVRGRTFLVPLSNGSYEGNGTITPDKLLMLRTAAQGLIDSSANELRIWSRPVNGAGGSLHAVTGYRIQDRVAFLKSRRS